MSRRIRPTVVAMLAVLAAANLGASTRHTALESSSPTANAELTAVPDAVTLRFTEAVQLRPTAITLSGPDGRSLELEIDGSEAEPREVRGPLPPDLPNGRWEVAWQTLALDGHVVEGTFAFDLSVPDPNPASGSTASPADADIRPDPDQNANGVEEEASQSEGSTTEIPILAALLRGTGIGLLATLAGLLVYLGWFVTGPAERTAVIARNLAWVVPLLLLGHLIAWLGYVRQTLPIPVSDILLYITPGRVELGRLTFGLLAGIAVLAGRRYRSGAVLAGLAIVASGFTGHSMSFSPLLLVPSRIIHIAALALWLGGLVMLRWTARKGAEYGRVAGRVSSIALGAVALMFATGVAHLLLYPTPLLDLAASFYGVLIITKLAGFGALVGLGAWNRFRIIPELPAEQAVHRMRRSVALEMTVMAALLLVTGVLAYTPIPEPPATALVEHRAIP